MMGHTLFYLIKRFLSISGSVDGVALFEETAAQQLTEPGLIFNNE